ncbi:DUF4007 family protein [Roseicyclus marinus]|uniref:DUF4007 family protein n=1 Tax=Roseicyclus marinus TaxID=2161673 RepID=UPI00240EFCDB|nr:DUF4007 family protein [Roseicyclus marinus]MDG3043128.1 DUF4007 family protein [Roseicyclus marinus]
MKFGGHETFFLRPGWLTKGLLYVNETENVVWNSDAASDSMGVGRNMSKSIGWWLNLTGLAHRPGRGEVIQLTPLGEAVLEKDPYFTETATWWFLHLVISLKSDEDVFTWFFQKGREDRFTKDTLHGELIRYLEETGQKVPALKSLDRDIAVLHQSYARSVPAALDSDPEDNLDCPFRRLGLLIHRSELKDFERRPTPARIPASAIGAALALSLNQVLSGGKSDIPIDFTGPVRRIGRCFGLSADMTAEIIMKAADALPSDLLAIRHLAGQRVATLERQGVPAWYRHHFQTKPSQSPRPTRPRQVA